MSTALIRSFHPLPASSKGGIVTIGNFDGVHLGHQALLEKVLTTAKTSQIPSVVLTFEPHPFEFFQHNPFSIPRLTRLREKYILMQRLGIDNLVILRFNQLLAKRSPDGFIRDLFTALAPRQIIVGDDFRFGYQRKGDFGLLKQMGETLGFEVSAMPTTLLDNERVSSTRVRKALAIDDLKLAQRLLGRPYSMIGRVVRGDGQGRAWGFPTANLFLHRSLTAVKGVYAVRMHGITAHPLLGVANVGIRPTVGGTRCLLEVNLFDFDQDIYGREVEVEFCAKLREEEYYPSIDLLKEQIARDVVVAKAYFENGVL
ncbi:MAG: bifunctional riboflavin kinase/FAD synthetase [Gammaproteobacteria bacterium]|nr:bifunctional riboflavin kinase/FAD synthetase [Gammaproteobacteria bacterium]